MQVRMLSALWAGKITVKLARLAGGKGSSFPGKVALYLFPQALEAWAQKLNSRIIVVTGTNGKTTTNNMLASIFSSLGYRVLTNREGANLASGLASAFIRSASWKGNLSCDWALLEVDEAAFSKVTAHLKPAVVVVTNFFRDQLDRYGELDRTVSLVKEALSQLPPTKLVLNADDPLVVKLADTSHPVLFYGIGVPVRAGKEEESCREARFCPYCGRELQYQYYHYSQLGAYYCPGCGFARPPTQVEALAVRILDGHVSCQVRVGDQVVDCELPTLGFYNVYNALAVFGVGMWLGLSPEVIARELGRYVPATGRLQRFVHRGRPVYLNLVKNPAGFNETLRLLSMSSETKDVFIALNDNEADGRDVSWIWDVDLENLLPRSTVLSFVCSGRRAADMAVRLRYAGVPLGKIEVLPRLEDGVRTTLGGRGKSVYFLATYSALWPVEKLLRRYGKEERDADRLPSLS
ncbi:Mur ligase family protein [Ammonifex thiophilus]|uniref:Lipid II isoglutaminyl synthase (glutamine-hydrolyzing) subunit MurT n=1 Tax=Ammonifex thiophilus TaxID=444093 RepID=A0A3D8P3T0_9THEO|nr:Mur ligase family protein [Ammonifex thiophilus]RDV82104.1 DUF1727 domain-containing protein [Ammonifex thiophilus]